MTEIEKARSNRAKEIDFNRLVNELAAGNKAYCEKMGHHFRTRETSMSMADMLSPAINLVSSLNAFLNRIGVDIRIAPLVIAALELLKDCRSTALDDDAKECARAIVTVLAPSITTIDMSLFKGGKK